MKKGLAVVAILLVMIGCQEDLVPKKLSSSQQAELSARDNARTMITIQQALDVTAGALQDKGVSQGRVATEGDHDNYGCAPSVNLTLNVDRTKPDSLIYSGTIIINYGDGSSCASTDRRTGKITDDFRIAISAKNLLVFVAKETITFDNFIKENSSVDGAFTVASASGKKTTIASKGMTLGYNDGTTSTLSGNLTFSYQTASGRKGNLTITGNLAGESRQGMPYTATITQGILFKGGCLGLTRKVPVSGKISIQTNGAASDVDYGDGTCDKNYNVTVDGQTETHTFG
ncbi:MAG TPA: hypothetical protein VF473_03410 [Cyclobacteriaceae bacterium]